MITKEMHAVPAVLLLLSLTTGTISSDENNYRMLTEFAVATQSSTRIDSDGISWSAEKVLDGCYDKSCTARTRGEPHNWIQLDLQNVFKISSVVIHAVTDKTCPTCPRNSLEDINIEMSKIKSSPLCIFEDVRVENERRQVVIRASDDGNSLPDSRYITISRDSQPLIIAEIEVFGDCPNSYCGRDCSEFCFCKAPFTSTEQVNGQKCRDGCLEGWEGEKCNKRKCDNDYFGADCRHICHCVHGCDPLTGECLGPDRRCLSGWSGQSCQKLALDPVFVQNDHLAADNNINTCVSNLPLKLFFRYPFNVSHVEITYKQVSDWSSNYIKLQLLSPKYKITAEQSKQGNTKRIGCDNKQQQTFMFIDAIVSSLEIQDIPGDLCETQFFVCAPGTFGPDCNSRCHCLNRSQCNNIDGACPDSRCEPYWTGKACDSKCSIGTFGEDCTRLCHCVNNEPCDYQTGICPNGCGPGWTDVACNRTCPVGIFGEGCKYKCGHCASDDVCHHVSGYCLRGCKPDWHGRRCLYEVPDVVNYEGSVYDIVDDLDNSSAVQEQWDQSNVAHEERSIGSNVTDVDSYGDIDFDIAGDLENDRVKPAQTDQALAAYKEINLVSNDESNLKEILTISGSVGGIVILTTAVITLCFVRCRRKGGSNQISKTDIFEEHDSTDAIQHIYEDVLEATKNRDHYNYCKVQSYEMLVKDAMDVPVTQFAGVYKKLLAAPKDSKPPLFHAFKSLESSENIYERVNQGTIRDSTHGTGLSYKESVFKHKALPENSETSFGKSSIKLLKLNDISFLVSDDSFSTDSLWEALVKHNITTFVQLGEPTMRKGEKLTLKRFSVECTTWKETDSITECKLMTKSLETALVWPMNILSCDIWEKFLEVPIDMYSVINLVEYLTDEMVKDKIVMIQCEHDINKAMLLSAVSAILFKMKHTGLVDILGPTRDARLGVIGSLSTYEQFKFLHDAVLFAIQKKRCSKENT